MRTIGTDEQEKVGGGQVLVIVAAIVTAYQVANICYEFGQGFSAGYNATIK